MATPPPCPAGGRPSIPASNRWPAAPNPGPAFPAPPASTQRAGCPTRSAGHSRSREPVTSRGFALTAEGDLNGTGRWTFEKDGPETVITYDWRVSTAKPLLRRLSWLLKPVFAANHRWAMARGQESLALELRRRRAATGIATGGPQAVPPPPPPTFAWLRWRG